MRTSELKNRAEKYRFEEQQITKRIYSLERRISQIDSELTSYENQINSLNNAINAMRCDTDENGFVRNPDAICAATSNLNALYGACCGLRDEMVTCEGELSEAKTELEKKQEEKEGIISDMQSHADRLAEVSKRSGGSFGAFGSSVTKMGSTVANSYNILANEIALLGGASIGSISHASASSSSYYSPPEKISFDYPPPTLKGMSTTSGKPLESFAKSEPSAFKSSGILGSAVKKSSPRSSTHLKIVYGKPSNFTSLGGSAVLGTHIAAPKHTVSKPTAVLHSKLYKKAKKFNKGTVLGSGQKKSRSKKAAFRQALKTKYKKPRGFSSKGKTIGSKVIKPKRIASVENSRKKDYRTPSKFSNTMFLGNPWGNQLNKSSSFNEKISFVLSNEGIQKYLDHIDGTPKTRLINNLYTMVSGTMTQALTAYGSLQKDKGTVVEDIIRLALASCFDEVQIVKEAVTVPDGEDGYNTYPDIIVNGKNKGENLTFTTHRGSVPYDDPTGRVNMEQRLSEEVSVKPGESVYMEIKCGQKEYLSSEIGHIKTQLTGLNLKMNNEERKGHCFLAVTNDFFYCSDEKQKAMIDTVKQCNAHLIVMPYFASDIGNAILHYDINKKGHENAEP